MSGEVGFFCKDCFSQWFIDWEDNDHPQKCFSCEGNSIGFGDLGREGDMVSELMNMTRDCEYSLYHEDLSEYTDLLRRMAHKYLELDKLEVDLDDCD